MRRWPQMCSFGIISFFLFFFFKKRLFSWEREHIWYTGPKEDTSVFILEKKLSDSLCWFCWWSIMLLYNDRRGGQEGLVKNLRTQADSYLIIGEQKTFSHLLGAGCLDQLVSSWASKKTFIFDNWFKPFVPISMTGSLGIDVYKWK